MEEVGIDVSNHYFLVIAVLLFSAANIFAQTTENAVNNTNKVIYYQKKF